MFSTQLLKARNREITPFMRIVAEKESLSPEFIRDEVAAGKIVIPANINHRNLSPIGIGKALYTKINANIGNFPLGSCHEKELEKLWIALKYGADTVMDLSTGPNIAEIRKQIIENSSAPVGTVPIYELLKKAGEISKITPLLLLEAIEEQAAQGVDYMTVHAGLLRKHLSLAEKRLMPLVSRGGSILAEWMREKNRENPFYEYFDSILETCRKYDVTLSLGGGLRPGCLADASDEAQFAELDTLGELVRRCREASVQSMVEGLGHIPLNEIEMNMKREDAVCSGAPFYILGPLVTDCAPGYDHISSAIGAALGAYHGAAMLCCVTPKEHLGLPGNEDVRNAVIAYKISAHAADIALKKPYARKRDDEISAARINFDWETQFSLALDPERAREFRKISLDEQNSQSLETDDKFCTMCGPEFCSMRNKK